MQQLDYYRAGTLDEALEILKQEEEGVKLICGGTDVLIDVRNNALPEQVRLLLDISGLEELKGVELRNGELCILSGTTLAAVAEDPLVREKSILLHTAAEAVGSQQIRNRGTVAGNIVTAAQCADTVPALLVLNATLVLKSATNSRRVPIDEFFTGPKTTALKPDEVLTEIAFTPPGSTYRGVFEKLMRRGAVAKSRLGLCVLAAQNEAGEVEDLRVSIGSSLPSHGRFPTVEQMLKGIRVEAPMLHQAGIEAGEYMVRVGGTRWSTEYKLPVVQSLTEKCLREVLEVQ